MLILDFDGVICDALTECALVTWLGIHQPPPGTRISAHAKAMPRNFVERFRAIRDYSRGLEHFMTAHRPMAANVRDQAHFDRLFGIFSAEYVSEFVASASAARARCREEEPEFWLDLHTLYPGVARLLRRHDGRVCVVTAKDEESVRRILRRHGLEDTVLEVVGETTRKAAAVRALMDRHGADVADTVFVDDNLTNALQVGTTGARVLWAWWGYHTAEHEREAARSALPVLRLEDLETIEA
jgi:phosphoglycolate phosphatase-like HAD superfamily hydrolase